MINVWMVRAVAILDVFLGVMFWVADIGLSVSSNNIATASDPSPALKIPAVLCVALGVVAALGYICLAWLLG